MIRKVCIDLGNGNMKGAEVRGKALNVVSLQSQVGVGDVSLGGLSLGNVAKRKRDDEPIEISFSGGTYLVGPNVARYAQPLERFDAAKYSDSMEIRALTYALLAQLVNGGEKDLAVVVALPVDVVMSANFKETVKGIEGWLLGEHSFTYDGRESHVTIHAVKCMAQPVGAFFAWGLNEHGEWTRDESDLTDATVAVLDSGFNTLDLLLVKQGRIEKRYTGGDVLGVRVAANEIARAVKAQYHFDMSMSEADAYIRQYLDRHKVPIVVAGERVDLAPIIRQALNSLATRTTDFVERTWRNANLSYVLLAGGGALVLDAPIRKQITHAQMLPGPVTANAIGLAKLAQRPGVFKGLSEG
ncbi:hypothetical protein TFLX_03117 [Thermoflexales bacterium]|nr:hypothetical protein TFLX_03117 [Thermoflexales bacterium]